MTPAEPRASAVLFGHEAASATLAAAAGEGRLHHAWLLTGPVGVGKATLAYRFARWLLAGRPASGPTLHVAPDDMVFRRVAAGSHADIRVLAPSAGNGVKLMIRVDEVRQIPRFLGLTAAEGGWRIVIVEQAEAMNAEAQNAMLKTLEEPPPKALLLLTTAAPDRLLPTIRSRCRRIDLFPLTQPEMSEVVRQWLPDLPPDQQQILAAIAVGSPGKLLQLAEGDGLALYRQVSAFLADLPRAEPRRMHQLADALAAKRDGSAFTVFMALLRDQLGAAIRAAERGEATPGFLAARPLADWAALWDTLGRLANETEVLNLDRKQAVLSGLSQLASR